MRRGNVIVGQSGGPTSVINSSLAGVIEGAREFAEMTGVFGMRWGIEGFMAGQIIDLGAEDPKTIQLLRQTPSSILGSSRHKVKDADFPVILARLKEYNIRYFFMAGGNDTMDTIHRVTEYARAQGYDLYGVGIPKTVDNDLYGTDHTPGFPSAARYVALCVEQVGRLARDMQKVDQYAVFQCIGRDAGWLSAAAALAKKNPDDAPHLIYMPEVHFDADRFLEDVAAIHKQHGFVFIVCGEGIKYADGTPVSASRTRDKFANVEYGAMGGASVAMQLHRMISEKFGWRGEFEITESLPMAGIDRALPQDLEEAYLCGRRAVQMAHEGRSGVMVTLERRNGEPYMGETGAVPLKEVAVRARPMPADFINAEGNYPAEACLEYLRPLVGPLPEFADMRYLPATPGA